LSGKRGAAIAPLEAEAVRLPLAESPVERGYGRGVASSSSPAQDVDAPLSHLTFDANQRSPIGYTLGERIVHNSRRVGAWWYERSSGAIDEFRSGKPMLTEIGRGDVQRMTADGAQLVDARSGEDFDNEHIAGAVSIPVKELDRETTRQLDKARPVITYCWDTQ
jgi:hypothetical protein